VFENILALETDELAWIEKTQILLGMLYRDLPRNQEAAIKEAMLFLDCGKTREETEAAYRVFSFEKDAGMIFAAFRQIHGIDLETTDLHWWKFSALFQSVIDNEDTPIGRLVGLRLRLKTGKATKEERAAAREMGEIINLDDIDDRTLEEKEVEQDFLRKVEQARMKRENNG